MWNWKPSNPELRQHVLHAWDPRAQNGLEKVLALVCEKLQLEDIALYTPKENWLSLYLVQPHPIPLQTPDTKSPPELAFSSTHPPKLRQREHHQRPHISKEPYPGTVSIALHLDDEAVAWLVATLRTKSQGRSALKHLIDLSGLLSRIVWSNLQAEQRHIQNTKAKRKIAAGHEALSATVSLERLLLAVMAQCARAIGYDSALVAQDVAQKSEGNTLHLHLAWQLPEKIGGNGPSLSKLIQVENINDTLIVTTADASILSTFGIKSILAVPIEGRNYVLALISTTSPHNPTPAELSTLAAYAQQLQLILEREKTFEEFEAAYLQTLHTTVQAIELSRPSLRGHHNRVAELACALGQRLGFDSETQKQLRLAAELHDVGLLGGPDAVVNAALEFQHPELGASMLSPLPQGHAIAQIVQEHHETFDGYGFPDGLSGAQVSQGGAVLAWAEFVVEHSTANPVSPSESLVQIAKRSRDESGHRFAPKLSQQGSELLLERSKEVFAGGSCVQHKSCPLALNGQCEASQATKACWDVPSIRRNCAQHGDTNCEGCFVWKTWGPGGAAG